MTEWQPIESAPKNMRIMLYRPARRLFEIGFGRWCADEYSKKPRPYWSGEGTQVMMDRHEPPTHWAPMPEPPR